jgi:hypothetical protein
MVKCINVAPGREFGDRKKLLLAEQEKPHAM